ncbi:MAG: DciA family protein [Hyphomicrobium sp.]|uniref:DUF721 domain-containing protein n=1 Tax=Hyphomicrobium sp. TaxID=82 RepID=UPI0035645563
MVDVLYDTTSEREPWNVMNGKQPTAVARSLPVDKRTSKGYFARSVGAYVPKVVAAAFEKYGFHTAEIMTSWETIVGADLARLTRPEAIKWPRGAKGRVVSEDDARSAGATLILASNPAFALEVSYRTQEIVDRINRYFGYRAIAQLRVVQMPNAETPAKNAPDRFVPAAKAQSTPPPVAEGLGGALDALANSIKAAAQAR